jgi:hypothetical protein
MTCDQTRAAFSDLYDEALSGPRLVTITQHLASCPACRTEWAKFRKAMQAMADLGTAEPSPGFAARVRRQLETPTSWRRALQWLFFPLHVKVPIQAVAVVLVAFAGLLLYQRSPELRRTIQGFQIPSSPGSREAPISTSPPPVGELARQGEVPAPRVEAPKAEQEKSQAPPMAAIAPRPAAPSDAEQGRGPSTPRDADKRMGETPIPSESPHEESSREFRAKTAEPGVPPQALRQTPAAPVQPGEATAPQSMAAPPSARRPSAALGQEAQTPPFKAGQPTCCT